MTDQVAVHGEETTVGFADVVGGPFTAIGGLNGEIPMPLSEREISQFNDNDGADPVQRAGEKKFSAIELAVTYTTKAAFDALVALDDGASHFLKFTLENGDWYVYRGMVNKVGQAGSFEEGFMLMQFGFQPAGLAASGVVTP
jgi:hypothetical protein